MKEYITVKELSEKLGVHHGWIRKKMKEWDLPYYRIGCKILFKKEEVDLWLEQQKAVRVN